MLAFFICDEISDDPLGKHQCMNAAGRASSCNDKAERKDGMGRLIIIVLAGLCRFAQGAGSDPLPLPPATIDGETINLACGRTYVGTMNLAGRDRVTLRTIGDCGKASLTPGVPVRGWRRELKQSPIWVAEIGFAPVQLQMDDRFLMRAHHPNSPGQWLSGESRIAGQLRTRLTNGDLTDALLVWRANDWLIQMRTIARHDGNTAFLEAGFDEEFGLLPQTEFYVEGKRWMLDAPGEWVHEDGKLYLWPIDGRSPHGRVWATPSASAVDARDSQNIRIEGIRIFGAPTGIDGRGSRGLQVIDSVIENSGEAAILAGSDMRVLRVAVRGSVQDGLRATDEARDIQVLESTFDDIGMLGMPRRSRGAIVFEQAQRVIVQKNLIRNAGYLGIRVFRDALVSENEIVGACQRLDDCAGIYTFARDRQPLHVRIRDNRISGLAGNSAFAIYLDDFSNGVTVTGNQIVDNPGGMQIHNGFQNDITNNVFVKSRRQHILFNETAGHPVIAGNRVIRNRFITVGEVPVYRLWSHHGGQHLTRFAQFADNTYRGAPVLFSQLEGRGAIGLSQWQEEFDHHGTKPAAPQSGAVMTEPASVRAAADAGSAMDRGEPQQGKRSSKRSSNRSGSARGATP